MLCSVFMGTFVVDLDRLVGAGMKTVFRDRAAAEIEGQVKQKPFGVLVGRLDLDVPLADG